MAQHPLIEVVLDAYKDKQCHDRITLAGFLMSAGELPKSKDITRVRKAYGVVAEHLLEPMLKDGILQRDSQGWYRRRTTASQ